VSPQKTNKTVRSQVKKNTYTPPIIIESDSSRQQPGTNQSINKSKLEDHIRDLNRRNDDKYNLFSSESEEDGD
jgi:hypothetical protein